VWLQKDGEGDAVVALVGVVDAEGENGDVTMAPAEPSYRPQSTPTSCHRNSQRRPR
jgi:hypothetical protein